MANAVGLNPFTTVFVWCSGYVARIDNLIAENTC
jgi:hypothetical protein